MRQTSPVYHAANIQIVTSQERNQELRLLPLGYHLCNSIFTTPPRRIETERDRESVPLALSPDAYSINRACYNSAGDVFMLAGFNIRLS